MTYERLNPCKDGCCIYGRDRDLEYTDRRARTGLYVRPMFQHLELEESWFDAASWPDPGAYPIGPIESLGEADDDDCWCAECRQNWAVGE